MIIGIDIDDTITKTSLLIKKYLKEFDSSYDNYHNLSRKKYNQFLYKYIDLICKNCQLQNGVKEAFAYFNKMHYTIVIVTARNNKHSKNNIQNTLDYLALNNLKYDKIYFKKEKKGKILVKNGVDLFIDDKEEVLDEVSKYNISCIKFGLTKSKYKTFDDWFKIVEYVKAGRE